MNIHDENQVVKLYLQDATSVEPLSAEREAQLFELSRTGDENAERTLLESKLRLVVEIAQRYRVSGHSYFELIQEGNIALSSAVGTFPTSGSADFNSYASQVINERLTRLTGTQS